jgi:hypothetical protein
MERAMSAIDAEVLGAGRTGIADSPFNPNRTASAAWSRSSWPAVNRNTPSSERSNPRASEGLTWESAAALGTVRADASVDVRETAEATDRGEPPVDHGRCEPAVLHPAPDQLDGARLAPETAMP